MEKSIWKNASFNVFNKTLSIAFPLVTISYVSRILGPYGIGQVSSAQNIISYFVVFASLGIPAYGVRAIAQTKESKKICNKTFTELFLINALSTLACLLLYFWIIVNSVNFQETLQLNIIFSSMLIFNIFNIEWVYQAFEEFRFIAIRSCVVKLASLIMLFWFCREADDVIVYGITICSGMVGNYILNMVSIFRYVRFDFKEICLSKHFKPILVFFAAVIAIELYSLVDVTMLTCVASAEQVGYYANTTKVVKTISGIFTAIGAVMMPRLSVLFKEKSYNEITELMIKVTRTVILLTIPSCVGIILTSHRIVPILFGSDFSPTISTLQILSALIVFMPISGGISAQVLQSANREKNLFLGVFGGTVINIVLNAIFINFWGRNGVAFASVITEAVVTVITFLYCKQVVKIKLNIKFALSVFFSTVIMVLALVVFERWIKSYENLCVFILEIIIGVITYFLAMLLIKNDEVHSLIKRVKEKFKKNGIR